MIGLTNYVAGMDQTIFHLVNGVWTAPILDWLMPALSWIGNLGVVWIVLLGAMAVFGKTSGRRIALAGLAALAIGFVASEVIKELTMRPRPFLVLPDVRLLIPEPSSFAFPSGHTTSAFAAAISYSRVYVGVHWPTDVAAGVLLGLSSGWLGARLVLRWWRPVNEPQGTRNMPEQTEEVEYVFGGNQK